MLAPRLLGKDARERIAIYEDLKRDIRQFDHMGHGAARHRAVGLGRQALRRVDLRAAGRLSQAPAGLRQHLSRRPRRADFRLKEAYADFAEACYALGYRAFKIHGWNDGNAREEAENVLHVARAVGDRMTLMLDPACELRTFADALYVGRACDEAGYFWYEDPFRDGGVSAFAHRSCAA